MLVSNKVALALLFLYYIPRIRSQAIDEGKPNDCKPVTTVTFCTTCTCRCEVCDCTNVCETTTKKDYKCRDGHSYNDGCNKCTCSNNAYSCTERLCINNPIICGVNYKAVAPTAANTCAEGHNYNDGCNNCTCNNNSYSCTEIYCPDNPIICGPHYQAIPTPPDYKCKVGHSYYDGCNQCTCSKGGSYFCTLKACFYNPINCGINPKVIKPTTCNDGHFYDDGCNKCTCQNNSYICTEKACIDNPIICGVNYKATPIPPDYKCPAGHSYFDGCNRCSCIAGSGGYGCTKKGCMNNPIKCGFNNHAAKKCD